MKNLKAIQLLNDLDRSGKYAFSRHNLSRLFHHDSPQTFSKTLERLVDADVLVRACRGIYVNPHAHSLDSYLIEQIAKVLRRGKYNYVSLESMLSEYGVISQIPIDRLTVMTTGRSGVYETPYGVIEFTHTKRSVKNILENTVFIKTRPLRIATEATALRDLRRVGRNLELINIEDLKNK